MAKKSPKKSASTARKTGAKAKAAAKPAGNKAAAKSAASELPLKASAKAPKKLSAATKTAGAAASAIAEGAKAPSFRLPRDGGETVSLADFAGRNLVIYFYPRADTPGCTREAIDFTRLRAEFEKSNTAVVGVSADPPKAQDAFRKKYELAIPLASDEAKATIEAYGAWGKKSMYGRTFDGILRTTVLVGADGRIVRIWRNVRVDGHADDVLEAARALPAI